MANTYKIHLPSLLSSKLGISPYVANSILHEAVLLIDDEPVLIREQRNRIWLNIKEEDWGKKLTVKGRTNRYEVQLDRDWEDNDYDRRFS